jgi:hypothetical protein
MRAIVDAAEVVDAEKIERGLQVSSPIDYHVH